MKVKFNYKQEHILQVPFLLEKAFREIGETVFGPTEDCEEPDLAINTMPWNGMVRGKKTVYWELDVVESTHQEIYSDCDVVYFPSRFKVDSWPANGKFLPMAVDFDYYHPISIKPTFDAVFMGRLDRSLRSEYIDKLKQGHSVLVGTAERGLPTCQELSQGMCSFQISEFSNLEQRNFEYSAVVPMVLERVPDLEVFVEDEHFKGFDRDNYDEFESQVDWCVKNYQKALLMRDRMVGHLGKYHLYRHRAESILLDI
jgi:hypothetical protein